MAPYPEFFQLPLRTHFLVSNVLDAAKALKLAFRAKGERGARRRCFVEAHLAAVAVSHRVVVRRHYQLVLSCHKLVGSFLVHLIGEGAYAAGIVVGAEFYERHLLVGRQCDSQVANTRTKVVGVHLVLIGVVYGLILRVSGKQGCLVEVGLVDVGPTAFLLEGLVGSVHRVDVTLAAVLHKAIHGTVRELCAHHSQEVHIAGVEAEQLVRRVGEWI